MKFRSAEIEYGPVFKHPQNQRRLFFKSLIEEGYPLEFSDRVWENYCKAGDYQVVLAFDHMIAQRVWFLDRHMFAHGDSVADLKGDIRMYCKWFPHLQPDYIKTEENGQEKIRFTRPGDNPEHFSDYSMPERFKLSYRNLCEPKMQSSLEDKTNLNLRAGARYGFVFDNEASKLLWGLLEKQGAYKHPQSYYIVEAAFAEAYRLIGKRQIRSGDILQRYASNSLMIDIHDLERSIIWSPRTFSD